MSKEYFTDSQLGILEIGLQRSTFFIKPKEFIGIKIEEGYNAGEMNLIMLYRHGALMFEGLSENFTTALKEKILSMM